MRFVVLGAGMQGGACAFDLARSPGVERIVLADADLERAERAAARFGDGRCEAVHLDVGNRAKLGKLLEGADCVVSAVPYFLNPEVARAAVAARTNFCDMGGNTAIVLEELELDAVARAAGITLVPDCGLAPGMANLLAAAAIAELDRADSVHIRVGGLPQRPRPPLDYQMVFSIHGLINEYLGSATVLRGGKRVDVPTFSEVESLDFPAPAGACEAFVTSGGLSTMPWTYEGRVAEMDYKTVRYPGHYDKFKLLLDLGLLEETPVRVGSASVRPRDVFAAVVAPRLDFGEPDLVVVRIEARGEKDGKPCLLRYEILDLYDEENGITAMMRTTAYPVSIVAQMLARGEAARPGALPLELAIDPQKFIAELPRRGIDLRRTVTAG